MIRSPFAWAMAFVFGLLALGGPAMATGGGTEPPDFTLNWDALAVPIESTDLITAASGVIALALILTAVIVGGKLAMRFVRKLRGAA